MVGDFLLLHGPEGAQAHMEGHIGQGDSHGLDLLQQLLGEMEPGGGGRRRSHLTGVHRLIALRVLKLRLDVRRQRHLAKLLQQLQENALIVKPDQPVAALQSLGDLGGEESVAEGELCSRLHLLAWPDQALPCLVSLIIEEQYLRRTSAGLPVAQQPGGQHP